MSKMSSCTEITRSVLTERIVWNGRPDNTIPAELVEHKNYVFSLLKATVQNGENNSALLIGPRGSGKSLVCSL